MGIGWNLPTENLFQTLAGYFSPNQVPATFIDSYIPSEIAIAHESEHRSLSMVTTVGKYQAALTLAAQHNSNQERYEQACRDLIDLCWYTHEGIATVTHTIEAIKMGGVNYTNNLNKNLPIAYRNALDLFLNIIDKKRLVYQKPHSVEYDKWVAEVFLIYKEAFRVLAIAAMSIPISRFINDSTSLPIHAILVAVRRDAPDIRLKSLIDCMKDDFVLRCHQVLQKAHEIEMAECRTEPVDNARISLANELCKKANISFEECYVIDDIGMLNKMGVKGIQYIDGRKITLGRRLVIDSVSVAVQSQYEMLIPIEMESAINLHKHAFGKIYKTKPDIVCEVLGMPGEENIIVDIHCYCNKEQIQRIVKFENRTFQESKNESTMFYGDNNSAFLLLRYSVKLPLYMIYELPKNLFCNTISWFISEPFKQEIAQLKYIDIERLNTLGESYVPAVEASQIWFASFESIKTIQARQSCAVPEIKISTNTPEQILSYDRQVPAKISLLTFYVEKSLDRYILPVVNDSTERASIDLDGWLRPTKGSYHDSCVCHALLYGLYGRFIARKLGGITL